MKKNSWLHLMVLISTLLVLSSERVFRQEFAFPMLRRNKGWTFLDRIKLGQGSAQVRFKAKMMVKQGQTTKSYAVQLSMVPDRLWATQQLMKCSRDSTSQVMSTINEQKQKIQQELFTASLSPQNHYEYGLLQIVQIPATETYHFILKDCEKQLISDYFSRESRLLVQLEIKNNGRDYGEDEGGNFYWFPLLIIGTMFMIYIIHTSFRTTKALDAKDTDYVKYLVYSCIWLNFISLIFKYIGYLIYFYAGVDYSFFDFMYLFFHSVADSTVVSLFIFIAFGWTITFTHGKDFDLYVPLLAMMGLITVILTLLNKITDGAHDKYHMYDTIPSYLLVFFKAITIIIFWVGCIKTIYESKKELRVKRFIYQISLLGSLYILTVPLIMIIVEYIPSSQRKEWVFIFIELGKTFINFLLVYMISYKKSGYRLINFGEQSFMQEGDRIL